MVRIALEKRSSTIRGEIITIATDGTTTRQPAVVDNLDALSEAGGGIEVVPGFAIYDGGACDAYVNDDSIHLGMPENRTATRLWWDQIKGDGVEARASRLHGPVAVMVGDEAFMLAQRKF